MLSPLSLFINLLLPNPFDDDEIERNITYYLRRTFMGYVPMVTWDAAVALAYALSENWRQVLRKTPVPIAPGLSRMVKEIIETTSD